MGLLNENIRGKKLYKQGEKDIAFKDEKGEIFVPAEVFEELSEMTDISEVINDSALFHNNKYLLKQVEELRQDAEEIHGYLHTAFGPDPEKASSQGPTGATGPRGATGPAGADGTNGTNGTDGGTGAPGAKGDKGDKGDQGIQGPKGDKGNPGTNGTDGGVGATGPKGDKGDQGIQGPKGDKGNAGVNGTDGGIGPTGPTGPTGPKGNTGSQGPKGDKGDRGDVGATGPTLNVTNNSNNRVITATGGSDVYAESKLTFDGTTLNIPTAQVDRAIQRATGIPTNNLGAPTITEMALFESQFTCKTDLSNDYDNLADLTFWVQSTSSSAWKEVTSYSDDQKRKFLRTKNSGVAIPNLAYKFRVEFNGKHYTFANAMYAYWSSQSHSSTVTIWKKRCSDGQWLQHTASGTSVGSWPGHLYLPFSTIPWHETNTTSTGHYTHVRIEFKPNWSGHASYGDRPIQLYGMEIWGGYPAGRRTQHYYDQNGTLQVTKDENVRGALYSNGTKVVENGAWVGSSSGLIGPKGDTGATGPQGPQGPAGSDGAKGDKGDTGPRGLSGTNGSDGGVGPAGPKGNTGTAGPQGPRGIQGLPGADGNDGATGPKGATGARGPAGTNGTNGLPGAKGDTGDRGPVGATGPQGIAGAKGATGAQGPTGPKGSTGNPGTNGSDGATGPAGPKGSTGSTGPQGPKGDTGNTGGIGPQGPQGLTGAKGSTGSTGPQGPQGPQGLKGNTGSAGLPGATGPQGPQGPAGKNGIPGATGPQGATGATGNSHLDNVESIKFNEKTRQLEITIEGYKDPFKFIPARDTPIK